MVRQFWVSVRQFKVKKIAKMARNALKTTKFAKTLLYLAKFYVRRQHWKSVRVATIQMAKKTVWQNKKFQCIIDTPAYLSPVLHSYSVSYFLVTHKISPFSVVLLVGFRSANRSERIVGLSSGQVLSVFVLQGLQTD